MKNRTKFLSAVTGMSVFAALAMTSTAAVATNHKPINAASPDSGTGCLVRASEADGYVFEPSCAYHVVRKYDKEGALVSYRYQDKGTLQPGQVAPDRALRIDISDANCRGTETITPSGNYSSNLLCKF